ncbi:SHOCT domain-containing protein [Georgenia sp. EYE_87]|uniref:SHOCT domain-containing protein n=1 Tax=Georgenia sp. EYE_87 TaxID=2853448 RepID=UPI0020047A42|nr:SHOCT domain-containing protein [Georgenia sp. EYE_87]MCK6209148.1 SHOCT domain-containing protein [Georgenia sp. EYE_87]
MFRNGLQPSHIIILFLVVLPLILVVVGVVLLVRRTQRRPQATTPQVGGPQWHPPPPASPVPDPIDQVRRLADLRDSGVISEEEYQARKNKLLGDI